MKKKVIIAGLYHETHTFIEGLTILNDFKILKGNELLNSSANQSIMQAVNNFANSSDWKLIPAIDLRATPSATVEDKAVDFFWNHLEKTIKNELQNGVDGIYLLLHGAMVSQSYEDVEGEILSRIRTLTNVPICGVLDLHANFTQKMALNSQGLIAYRKNPHTDAVEAALDAAILLNKIMNSNLEVTTVWAHPPVMWPPTGTATNDEPMQTLESMARKIETSNDNILAVNVFAGFAFADTKDTGVSFTAITEGSNEYSAKQLQKLYDYTLHNKEQGNKVSESVDKTLASINQSSQGPIILVEESDNIGAGSPGDCTGVLRALIKHKIKNSLCTINDPEAVKALTNIGIGNTCKVSVGGKGSKLDAGPLELDLELVSVSNGKFQLEDPTSPLASMGSSLIDMGHCAVARHKGITILLTSNKTPPFDLGQLYSQGLRPENFHIIVVKAAVAHRRAYDPITKKSYTVNTPGPCSSNLSSLPYRKIKRPIYPLDKI